MLSVFLIYYFGTKIHKKPFGCSPSGCFSADYIAQTVARLPFALLICHPFRPSKSDIPVMFAISESDIPAAFIFFAISKALS